MGGLSSFFKAILKFLKAVFRFIRKYFAIFLIIFIALTPFLMPFIGLGGTWLAWLPSWLSWLPAFVSFFGGLGFPGVIAAALGLGYLVDSDSTVGLIKDVVDVGTDIVKEGVDLVTDVVTGVGGAILSAIPTSVWLIGGAIFAYWLFSDDKPEEQVVYRDAWNDTAGLGSGNTTLEDEV